ncbi:hypothetical protein [Bacillus sp. AFS040349]|uniref:hypothetical protein n=1 Tax=Bacillus sp. AFS040349 TaxID=2033502 RepID=UPI000BFE9B65|nr:hypothetical protein [Bacillus sp. AFS040349]PGT81574.1 hypothetical protein COD11_17285 [Bacillus sp. AFS040349]
MAKTTITEKEVKLMDYLIKKVLVEKKTLDEKEVKALQDILKKLEKIEKDKEEAEKKSLGLSEVVEHSMNKVLVKQALKESNALEFNALPVKSKAQKLKEQIDQLEKSSYFSQLKKQEAEEAEKREFEEFYAEYVRKHGKTL